MGCPIKGCPDAHKNQWEHFNDPKRGVTNEVTTPKSVPKKAVIEQVTTVTTPVTMQRKSSQKEIDKVKAWRKANREKYNAYMKCQRAKKRGVK